MSGGLDPLIWQWIGLNLWIPLTGLVVTLLALLHHGDMSRVAKVEAAVAASATKEEVARIEAIATKAVYEEQFREYAARAERSRQEMRTAMAEAFADMRRSQEKFAEKLEHLTERVVASGFVHDDRRDARHHGNGNNTGPLPKKE